MHYSTSPLDHGLEGHWAPKAGTSQALPFEEPLVATVKRVLDLCEQDVEHKGFTCGQHTRNVGSSLRPITDVGHQGGKPINVSVVERTRNQGIILWFIFSGHD